MLEERKTEKEGRGEQGWDGREGGEKWVKMGLKEWKKKAEEIKKDKYGANQTESEERQKEKRLAVR